VVSKCHFPGTTGEFEPLHGSGGVKPGGRAIYRENFFGQSDGYSDIIDFTGGNREKGEPVVQFTTTSSPDRPTMNSTLTAPMLGSRKHLPPLPQKWRA